MNIWAIKKLFVYDQKLFHCQQQAKELLVVDTALQQESAERKLAEERALALIDNLPGGAAFVVDRDLRYLRNSPGSGLPFRRQSRPGVCLSWNIG